MQAQAIKKFIQLKKELKDLGYQLSNKYILDLMEIQLDQLNDKGKQIVMDWFINTTNQDIIEELEADI